MSTWRDHGWLAAGAAGLIGALWALPAPGAGLSAGPAGPAGPVFAAAPPPGGDETPRTLPAGTYGGACRPWVHVNDGAFGLGVAPYTSEEGFELTVHGGKLYVGMEADNTLGARVWRTRDGVAIATGQADWEQVVPDAFGDVANNDHIDSLAGFGGHLYASTAVQNASHDGSEVWRSASGAAGTWTQVNHSGFPTPPPTAEPDSQNFKDMLVFDGADTPPELCAGTGNATTGTQVFCTDGVTLDGGGPRLVWTQRNLDGFDGAGTEITSQSADVWGGRLYIGTARFAGFPGSVWRTDGTLDGGTGAAHDWLWENVFTAPANNRVDVVGPYAGHLYVAFDGGSGTEVWRSATGASGSWAQVNLDGFDGDAGNGRAIVDGQAVYNGLLYVAPTHASTGVEIWRTDGSLSGGGPELAWARANPDGFGFASTFAAELAELNGYLYAWTSDYTRGQEVLRSKCPICQSMAITGPGAYDFDGVGATLDVTSEDVDSVEVCVFPDAFPDVAPLERPIKRHFEITSSGGSGSVAADMTLAYAPDDADELDPSDIADEATTYLRRWTGGGWADCPSGDRSRDTGANTVTCAGVTELTGLWSMSGTLNGPPMAVTLESLVARRRGRAVVVAWRTATETGHAGFRVLRDAGGGAVVDLTPRLVAPRGSELGGADYTFTDATAPARAVRYWIEDVDNHGRSERHGPVLAPRVGR